MREKTCGKSSSHFDKEQQLYLSRKLSNALHSRESIHHEMRSVSSSESTTLKSIRALCTSESGESTDITVGALSLQKRRLLDSVQTDDASETISGESSLGMAPSVHPTSLPFFSLNVDMAVCCLQQLCNT